MKLSLVELFYLALPESLEPHEPKEAQGVLSTVEAPKNGRQNSTKFGATLVTSTVYRDGGGFAIGSIL